MSVYSLSEIRSYSEVDFCRVAWVTRDAISMDSEFTARGINCASGIPLMEWRFAHTGVQSATHVDYYMRHWLRHHIVCPWTVLGGSLIMAFITRLCFTVRRAYIYAYTVHISSLLWYRFYLPLAVGRRLIMYSALSRCVSVYSQCCKQDISKTNSRSLQIYHRHSLHRPTMLWLIFWRMITFKMTENEWPKMCNFHTGHFPSGALLRVTL